MNPQDISCPSCHVPAGEPCVSRKHRWVLEFNGRQYSHLSREAAASCLTATD